jgi:mannosyltransferase OCH1-like enzyme
MIPKIIWQTYECNYDELDSKALEFSYSWKKLNLEWEYRYVSGQEREEFVLKHFGEEWHKIYLSYTSGVLRADLWRYMCLYVNGGLYCDLDILCKKPIEYWLDTKLNFVVSEEPYEFGYTQMLFASSPNNIFLENVLKDIKKNFYLNRTYKDVIDYVINEAGYLIFTNSINNTLSINNDGFMLYNGEDSKKIHEDSIEHYRAGDGNVFQSNYVAWKNEKVNKNDR